MRLEDTSEGKVTLKDIKESYPIETFELVKTFVTDDKPSFLWWIPVISSKKMSSLDR